MASKGNILIVDDENEITEILHEELIQKGYTIHIANSGNEAIKILNKEPIEILLTDIRMPGMDGIELMKTAKKNHEMLQCIVITGQGNYDLAIEAMKAGAINFLRKPVQMDVDVIDAALENGMKVVRSLQKIVEQQNELEKANKELEETNIKLEESLKESKEECLITKATLLMNRSWYYYQKWNPRGTYCDICEEIEGKNKKHVWSYHINDNGSCEAKTFVRYLNGEAKRMHLVTLTTEFVIELMKNNEGLISKDQIQELEKELNEFEKRVQSGEKINSKK